MRVTDLLLNFRSGLLALVPVVERANIPWRRPDAYDDWDAVATMLFDKLVVEVIRWSLQGETQDEFRVQPYDLLLPAYEELSTLEVSHPSLPPGRWLFHAFGTDKEPFDIVEVREISEDGLPLQDEIQICSLEGTAFRLRLSPLSELIDDVEVAV